MGIWGWVTLCGGGGRPVQHWVFGSISGLYVPAAPTLRHDTHTASPDIAKCPEGLNRRR